MSDGEHTKGDPSDGAVTRPSVRRRGREIKPHRCRHLIAVIEDPVDIKNIGTVIRNVNALGVEKAYVVDPRRSLPADWQVMRGTRSLSKSSASAIKWSFVKRFDDTEACLDHLEQHRFVSVVTSPHVTGRHNVTLHEGDYTIYPKLAVWFGNEARGISALALQKSELCISVPMFGMIESLNLGSTSGIVLQEITKQRREYQRRYRWRNRRGRRDDAPA